MPVVDRLFVYPIKSCAGIELETADLDDFGFRHDRRWMVVDPTGRFITQRQIPRMALVRPVLTADGLTMHAPDADPFVLSRPEGPARAEVSVWRDRVQAAPAGDAAAAWFSRVLGTPCRPVFIPDDSFRPAGRKYGGRARVSFADSFPFLIVSREAVDLVSERAGMPLSVRRFRPNIVVSGVEPHAEDGWCRIRIGQVPFAVVKPCSRCVVTTIDPETGEAGKEPLRTLATYRKRNGKVLFGQNAVHESTGTIRLGNPVTVL
jgi:uncharacterized protein YcbX